MTDEDKSFAGRFILAAGYLGVVAVATHALGRGWIAFALLPFSLFLVGPTPFRLVCLYAACALFFFEAYTPSSNFLVFVAHESLLIAYGIAALLRGPQMTMRIPISRSLVLLCLFVAYTSLLTVPSLVTMGFDYYAIRDLLDMLYLLLVLPWLRTSLFGPANVVRLLLLVIVFSALHAVTAIINHAMGVERYITWNEVFFSCSIILTVVVFTIIRDRTMRIVLVIAGALNIFASILVQTRGLWLSTLVSLSTYTAMQLVASRRITLKGFLKATVLGAASVVAVLVVLQFVIGFDLPRFVLTRLADFSKGELTDPASSMGFRIYESYRVWQNRSLIGHGSGARLYLYFPLGGYNHFRYWWYIHSEYFEMLHKYGFLGLGLFLSVVTTYAVKAARLVRSRSSFRQSMGMVSLLMIVNVSVVSITSGYFSRVNMMWFLMLIYGIIETYSRQRCPDRTSSHPAETSGDLRTDTTSQGAASPR